MKIKTRQELEAKRAEYAASLKTQKKQILICAGTGEVYKRQACGVAAERLSDRKYKSGVLKACRLSSGV